MGLRYCQEGGLLVGGKERLPTDENEYRFDNSVTGCNNLHCQNCGAKIRSGPPDVRPRPDERLDKAVVYATEDWLSLPSFQKDDPWDKSWRHYSCKCSDWQLTLARPVENDHDAPSDPNVPWACAGHAEPQLPLVLGPLTIAADSDWASVVEQILAGACPRPLTDPQGPATWLTWLYAYLGQADQLSAALAESADVGRACYLFRRFPRAGGVERVMGREATGVALLEGGTHTRWDVLMARLAQRAQPMDAVDQRAVELFREAALTAGDAIKDALSALRHRKAFDADDLLWIATNIAAIEDAGAGRWQAAMGLLAYWGSANPELPTIGGVALIESGLVPLSAIREWLKRVSPRKDPWVLPLEVSLQRHGG